MHRATSEICAITSQPIITGATCFDSNLHDDLKIKDASRTTLVNEGSKKALIPPALQVSSVPDQNGPWSPEYTRAKRSWYELMEFKANAVQLIGVFRHGQCA